MKLGRRWRRILWIGGPVLSVVALLACVPLWAVRLCAWATPGIVWFEETSQPVAALTFDDGPDPVYTPQVLAVLERHHVRATFFLVGRHARQHPELVARIRAAGHKIGNHTDSLGTTFFMSADAFEASLLRAEQTLALDALAADENEDDAAVRPLKLLRPAGATIRPAQLRRARQHGYVCVLGSSYGWDPYRPPAGYIEWAMTKNLRPGAIAVLHDAGGNRSNSIAALEAILADAEAKGLRWVTLSELLSPK